MGRLSLLLAFLVLSRAVAFAQGGDNPAKEEKLPVGAQKLLKDAEQDVEKSRKNLQAEELAIKTKLIADLQKLLEAETKKGNLDGALAIRSAIEQLKAGAKLAGPDEPALAAIKKILLGGRWSFVVLGTPYSAVWEFKEDGSIVNSDGSSVDKKWSIETINKSPVLRVGLCVFQLTPNTQKLQGMKSTSNEKVELTRIAN